jgi:Riboflavin kinase
VPCYGSDCCLQYARPAGSESRCRPSASCWHLGTLATGPGRNSTLLCADCLLQTRRRFAKLSSRRRSQGIPAADGAVHGMVMNIGERPTMADGGGVTVEVGGSPGPGAAGRPCSHVLCLHSLCSDIEGKSLGGQVHVFDHKFSSDFYGLDMTVLICGFLRCGQALLVDSMACVADCPPSCL